MNDPKPLSDAEKLAVGWGHLTLEAIASGDHAFARWCAVRAAHRGYNVLGRDGEPPSVDGAGAYRFPLESTA